MPPLANKPLDQVPPSGNGEGRGKQTSNSNANPVQEEDTARKIREKGALGLITKPKSTTPKPDPDRPTSKISSGLLIPAAPETEAKPTKKTIIRIPSKRPSKLNAKVPTTRPVKTHSRPAVRSTRRPASLLSANRGQDSSTTARPASSEKEDYKNVAGEKELNIYSCFIFFILQLTFI